jgi:tetratricopeptide (TPR) repeat protein
LTDLVAIPGSLLAELRQDIIERRIRSGMERLDENIRLVEAVSPSTQGGAELVWRLAQWVDAGWRDIAIVQSAVGRFPKQARRRLSLHDYSALRMAEGMVAMSGENLDEAVGHFDAVLTLEPDLDDRELSAIANFWKARCQRKRGEYDAALSHTAVARTLATECGYERMAAVMRVLESWLFFQKGRHKEALKVLAETQAVLSATDDAVVLGNIQSTYGRIYRQEGRYDRAIEHFQCAIDEYRKVDTYHPNLARTLANMAYVERVVALEFRRKLEADLSRRKHRRSSPDQFGAARDDRPFLRGSVHVSEEAPPQAGLRDEFVRIRDDAFAHLDEAAAIYRVHPNYRGAGTVHLNRGLLHLDNGALDLAEEEAAAALALGEQKEDLILMARARLLQCMVENAKVEEGIDEDPRHHAQAALDHIRDAIEFARKTQNRRLLARVHTWHGLTLSNEFFCAHDAAMDAMNTASSFLDHAFHDTAWEDLRVLKTRVIKTQTIDETLLAWSQGAVGDRSFREIAEQFAEIIIPKVWEIEGRKIARVATRLSVSPKKVRRALKRAGLLRPGSRADAAFASD